MVKVVKGSPHSKSFESQQAFVAARSTSTPTKFPYLASPSKRAK